MGTIRAQVFMSLDGVVESPESWHFPYLEPDMTEAVARFYADATSLLFGRRTYDAFVAVWPHQGLENELARQINALRRFVVTSSGNITEWPGTAVLPGPIELSVARLRDETDGVIGVPGSPTLIRGLLSAGLLDEIEIMVHPLVLGAGARLFEGATTPASLELVEHGFFASGVVDLVYAPVDTEPAQRLLRSVGDVHREMRR